MAVKPIRNGVISTDIDRLKPSFTVGLRLPKIGSNTSVIDREAQGLVPRPTLALALSHHEKSVRIKFIVTDMRNRCSFVSKYDIC